MTKERIAELRRETNSTALLPAGSDVPPASVAAETPPRIWDQCAGKDRTSPILQIRGCTTLIESGQETLENLSIAFSNRGNAHQAEADYDSAITDYNRAIQLNPSDPIIFSNRGNAYKRKGEIDRAIADFSEAIRLDPEFAEAFANRGLVRLKKREAGANDDIAIAKSMKPALASELARQQALITAPRERLEDVPLPRPRPQAKAGSTVTSISPVTPPSTEIHRNSYPAECPHDQVCQ